ncbi:MAG: sucrase ferredoxin [Nocardioides sp.]
MSDSPSAVRCSAASLRDHEPMAGTAPTDTAWLLVEYAGSWGRQAVAESRLPEDVRTMLAGLAGVRVQLVRRHGGWAGPGVHVFAAHLGEEVRVWGTVLDDVEQLLGLDLGGLASGADPGLPAYDGPLWLVCTNGRRDRCCAEIGRPVAAALAERWPTATWETTHLGGHRFSGTLLALPSGVVLGRLDETTAVAACTSLEEGRLPLALARGRAGRPAGAQVAELHVRAQLGIDELAGRVETLDERTVAVTLRGETRHVTVTTSPGEPRRQSCADLTSKATDVHEVLAAERVPDPA